MPALFFSPSRQDVTSRRTGVWVVSFVCLFLLPLLKYFKYVSQVWHEQGLNEYFTELMEEAVGTEGPTLMSVLRHGQAGGPGFSPAHRGTSGCQSSNQFCDKKETN